MARRGGTGGCWKWCVCVCGMFGYGLGECREEGSLESVARGLQAVRRRLERAAGVSGLSRCIGLFFVCFVDGCVLACVLRFVSMPVWSISHRTVEWVSPSFPRTFELCRVMSLHLVFNV